MVSFYFRVFDNHNLTEKHRTAPPYPARSPEVGDTRTYDEDSGEISGRKEAPGDRSGESRIHQVVRK
jgi:hypothetical protein